MSITQPEYRSWPEEVGDLIDSLPRNTAPQRLNWFPDPKTQCPLDLNDPVARAVVDDARKTLDRLRAKGLKP